MQKLWHIGSIKDLRPQNTQSTNINHKGLQRAANEYAGERRIYKDLISKNEKYTYKILQAEYCNADRTEFYMSTFHFC